MSVFSDAFDRAKSALSGGKTLGVGDNRGSGGKAWAIGGLMR